MEPPLDPGLELFGVGALCAVVLQRVDDGFECAVGAEVVIIRRRAKSDSRWRRSIERYERGAVERDFDAVHLLEMRRVSELGAVLARPDPFLIVGRNPDAFAGLPQRLQQTEHLINHVYALMTGQHADLLAAVRSMSRPAAQAIVEHAKEEGIGNDVEWPLLALRLGFAVTHVEVAGISYRTIEEYGAAADSLDAEPLQWIRRIEFAAEQARVLRKFP